jgi:hypothetical protein
VPAAVEVDAVIVIVVLHVGVHDDGEKEAVAPDGSPLTENDTATAVPDVSVSTTFAVMDCPSVTVPEAGVKAMSNLNGITVSV